MTNIPMTPDPKSFAQLLDTCLHTFLGGIGRNTPEYHEARRAVEAEYERVVRERDEWEKQFQTVQSLYIETKVPKWRCFHCDETFNDWGKARNHFGWSPEDGKPVCTMSDADVYHMRRRLEILVERDKKSETELARLTRELDEARKALENVRMYAAKLRDHDLRRLCAEGGVEGSPLRDAALARSQT